MSGFGTALYGVSYWGDGSVAELFNGTIPLPSASFINTNLGIDLLLDDDRDMVVSTNGDLLLTFDGKTCLKQDVRNVVDTLPGELYGHADYGCGIGRMLGKENSPEYAALGTRSIDDALIYNNAVASRLDLNSIEVEAIRVGRTYRFSTWFAFIGSKWTNRLNLVWYQNTKEF